MPEWAAAQARQPSSSTTPSAPARLPPAATDGWAPPVRVAPYLRPKRIRRNGWLRLPCRARIEDPGPSPPIYRPPQPSAPPQNPSANPEPQAVIAFVSPCRPRRCPWLASPRPESPPRRAPGGANGATAARRPPLRAHPLRTGARSTVDRSPAPPCGRSTWTGSTQPPTPLPQVRSTMDRGRPALRPGLQHSAVDRPLTGRHVASPHAPAALQKSPRAYSKLTRSPVLSKIFKFMPLVFAV
ncbi:proline-rich extensin-like protein EPR1 [Sorghum bicolor]|uniref:proline-rich extensin-like protein EPR1 n=1 Tax=Sorghum bicolor TaxID=4558 RepID=UPI000B425D1F|nr:proline-rich extensin-like protein EPR1 [Sorghum bicolor]|eukprot:XP_021306302.1 proline-rich extensin-like protein EPR1 [Sorghum bicolor]